MTPPLNINPSQPSTAAATGGTYASGTHQETSGITGEYAFYKQWLTVNYTRNPVQTDRQPQNASHNLSQCSGTDVVDVYRTELHCNITAHSECVIVSGIFSTSSFYQPQKLTITPIGHDKQDTSLSYGDVTGSGVVFGPQGSIHTHQPYILRRPRIIPVPGSVVGDVPYNITNTGTTHHLRWTSNCNDNFDPYYYQGDEIGQSYNLYLSGSQDIHELMDARHAKMNTNGFDSVPMQGAYTVSAEPGYLNNFAGMQRFSQFIESVCASLANPLYPSRLLVSHPANSTGQPTVVEADRLPIDVHYNSSHHDYT